MELAGVITITKNTTIKAFLVFFKNQIKTFTSKPSIAVMESFQSQSEIQKKPCLYAGF